MVARAVFYSLTLSEPAARWHFTCRFAEKMFNAGKTLLILCNTPEEAQQLNQQLWHFTAEAFVPHHLAPEQPLAPWQGVCISAQEPTDTPFDVLFNLALAAPQALNCFGELVEFVIQEEPWLSASRAHYRHYQQLGIPVTHHSVTQK